VLGDERYVPATVIHARLGALKSTNRAAMVTSI
jgi:hypothetical protein